MRLLKWVGSLGLICSSLLAQPGQAQNAPPPPPGPGQFSFLVCNNSGLNLFFAFIYLNSATDLRYRTTGWFSVNAGECPHSLGNFTVGKFYYFAVGAMANSTQYLVQGTVLQQCVHLPEAFDRVDLGGVGCKPFPRVGPIPPGDYLAGFAEVSVPPTVGAITVLIKPPQ
jgi:hypothetical protein